MGDQKPETSEWMCFQCNLAFDHLHAYKTHVEKHPPIDLISDSDDDNETRNECTTDVNLVATSSPSSDSFSETTMSDLSDDRPFKCAVCARHFKTKGQLKTHSARHTNRWNKKKNNLKCLSCNRTFLVKPHLKDHKCLGRRKTCS